MNTRSTLLAFLALSLTIPLLAGPKIGETLKPLTLADEDGGKIVGGAWNSQETNGYATIIFYVDPDESKTNDHVSAALKNEHYPPEKLKSIAVINLAASWIPNALINSTLKDKQIEFPNTVYVKDARKALVKKWGFADDSNTIAFLSKTQSLLFYKSGKLSSEDIKSLLALVSANL